MTKPKGDNPLSRSREIRQHRTIDRNNSSHTRPDSLHSTGIDHRHQFYEHDHTHRNVETIRNFAAENGGIYGFAAPSDTYISHSMEQHQTENLHSPRGFRRLTSHDQQRLKDTYEYAKVNETPQQFREKEERRQILTGEKYEREEREKLLNNVQSAIHSAGGFLGHINRTRQDTTITRDHLFFKDAGEQLRELQSCLIESNNVDHNNEHLVWLRDMMHARKDQTINQWITDKYPNYNLADNTSGGSYIFLARVSNFLDIVHRANIPGLEDS